MEHGIGSSDHNNPSPVFLGTPDDAIVGYVGGPENRYAAPLNTLADGTPVIMSGMVTEIREHGDVDSPRATFILSNDLGHGAYVAVDTDTLATYSMCLMDGVELSIHGHVRKPFDDGPPYISVLRVEPLFA